MNIAVAEIKTVKQVIRIRLLSEKEPFWNNRGMNVQLVMNKLRERIIEVKLQQNFIIDLLNDFGVVEVIEIEPIGATTYVHPSAIKNEAIIALFNHTTLV